MCRLILARGDFRTDDIVDAALAMSTGITADHEGPIRVHPNGWGAVWQDPAVEGGLGIYRDVRSMADSVHESPVRSVRSDFLTIHTRHATLQRNAGLQFTHPLERIEDGFTWYFMHNGFLPTVYQLLGLPRSEFDSAEYFQYIVPRGSMTIDEDETRLRLRAIPPGGTSGNSVAVTEMRLRHPLGFRTQPLPAVLRDAPPSAPQPARRLLRDHPLAGSASGVGAPEAGADPWHLPQCCVELKGSR